MAVMHFYLKHGDAHLGICTKKEREAMERRRTSMKLEKIGRRERSGIPLGSSLLLLLYPWHLMKGEMGIHYGNG